MEDWLTREQVLPQAVASDLRTVIATAVAQRYRWVNPLMREQTQATIRSAWPLNARVVSIEGATENIQARTQPRSSSSGRHETAVTCAACCCSRTASPPSVPNTCAG